MYVSTSRAADGTASVGGYAFDGATQVLDDFRLDLVRGGATVASATGPGFVRLAPAALAAGDALVLTDVTTAASRTATFTGQPTLSAPGCGAAGFSGTREDGSTVDVSAGLGADSVPTVQLFGAGTSFAGSFAKALRTGWSVQAAQARVIDAGFTVFDAVGAVVGGTCPGVAPAAPVVVAPAPVVVAPAPVAVPAAVTDAVPPTASLTMPVLFSRPALAYKALIGGKLTGALTVDEPGSVTQTLYLDDGATLPKATAAADRKKAATVLGTVATKVKAAGTVPVTIKVSKKGRARLRVGQTKLALVTVVRDAAGNARTLPARRFAVLRLKR